MIPARPVGRPSHQSTECAHDGPFTLSLSGHSTIPHLAERALILLTVSDTHVAKSTVSERVLATAKQISDLCRALSPKDSSSEAKAAAPLAHWTQTSLSSTSHIPYTTSKGESRARQYTATVSFHIRFKVFDALGPFAAKITSLPCVEIPRIDWILLPATKRAFQSRLRCEAAADALQKAKDYCSVLCASLGAGQDAVRIRPVELIETSTNGWLGRSSQQMAQQQQMQQMQQQSAARSSGVFSSAKVNLKDAMSSSDDGRERNESGLDFQPQEVRMTMDVQVKFAVDTLGVPVQTSAPNAKRQRPSDEDEELEGFGFEHV